jgi:hypothetical protein
MNNDLFAAACHQYDGTNRDGTGGEPGLASQGSRERLRFKLT